MLERRQSNVYIEIGLFFFIIYEVDARSRDSNTKFKIGDCLFVAQKLTETVDPDKCGYIDYGVRFNKYTSFPGPGQG